MPKKPPKKKRESGGKRAGDKRRAVRAAAEAQTDDFRADWQKRVDGLGDPPLNDTAKGVQWLANVALMNVRRALANPSAAPDPKLTQIGKLIADAVKALDPAKLSEQLDELERALEESENARAQQTREDSPAQAPADLV